MRPDSTEITENTVRVSANGASLEDGECAMMTRELNKISPLLDARNRPQDLHIAGAPFDDVEGNETALPDLGILALENGEHFLGYSFGSSKSISGELVFQTGMVGYPESLSDPSYRGQILVLTYPIIGNYGVSSRKQLDAILLPLQSVFESNTIQIAGLIVSTYIKEFSHYKAASSLSAWLKEHHIPALFGVDTRALTKLIRENGVMLGAINIAKPKEVITLAKEVAAAKGPLPITKWLSAFENVGFHDPNTDNLVKLVSTKEPYVLQPPAEAVKPGQTPPRVLILDVGMKANQSRCLLRRGFEVKVVPWDYDLKKEKDFYGLFISNGPGDPALMNPVGEQIECLMKMKRFPIFGICFGHQLMARAAGARTIKMKYGNRGMNIPCVNTINKRCYITSQNHGYAVDASSLPPDFKEWFFNANDGSNEGMYHTSLPYFSVQFHPEYCPGPRDTEFLFDIFAEAVNNCFFGRELLPVQQLLLAVDPTPPHALKDLKKILILGSGGLSIGQAGEFDYSGSQAIKALKEEGFYTVLINPNIATIQTSKGLADKVYFLPVTPEFVRKVIQYEKPDSIYVTFGGQTALNVGIALKDEFEELGVKVLGTPIETIITTEDRDLFAKSMVAIGAKCAKSASANSLEEALEAVKNIGFPVILRSAYALGGLGSGFANNKEELIDLCNIAFASTSQVLIEKSLKGWKEIEYEVVRDCYDNCITVCNMENFDPLGIHTGDSIVIAPSQTLSDDDYNLLRSTAIKVIRHLGVIGECNIQYALDPLSKDFCIIEVNARLSRSSALASKATGFPLAFVAAKLGLNKSLDSVKNSVTKVTCACFEPSLDYVAVKIPRWDLKKFSRVSTKLGSAMKSVGEVMGLGRTFEEAFQKAIRSIDYSYSGFGEQPQLDLDVDAELTSPSDMRIFAIASAFAQGYSVDRIHQLTNVDRWFLYRLESLTKLSNTLKSFSANTVPAALIRQAKQLGFSDLQLAHYFQSNEIAIRQMRTSMKIFPFVKQIDTVAAEFPAYTNYLYLTYNGSEHDIHFNDCGIMVLGSGVYRIGSSVEFDWCAVRSVRTLRDQGMKTIMVNYNPETVSTDYDEADRLYFENISLETVLDIYELENSGGVIVSMGGQTPNNIALDLFRQNVKILGTSPEMIDSAENRYKFSRMLDTIGVDQPAWKELSSLEEAYEFCDSVQYPVLVRPSYVLSGAAMNIVYSKDDLASYLKEAVAVNKDYPVVISKFIEDAKEIEMDAVAKDGELYLHFISEHVENAGTHSGDATLIHPPQDLDPKTVSRIEEATAKIANALYVTGPFNIQFIAKNNEIKVIECNVRAARSFPFVSKVTGVDMIELATKLIAGIPVEKYPIGEDIDVVGVKVPQFSFSRLIGADPVSGVEMASTGEVACFGKDKYGAFLKAIISSTWNIPKKNILLSIGSFKEKMEILSSVRRLYEAGFQLFATAGTSDFLEEHGIQCEYLQSLTDSDSEKTSKYSITQHLANNMIDLCINLPSKNQYRRPADYISDGYKTRRLAIDYQVPLVTNIKFAKLMIESILRHSYEDVEVGSVDFQTSNRTLLFGGLINIATYVPNALLDVKNIEEMSRVSMSSGFCFTSIMPRTTGGDVINEKTFVQLQKSARGNLYCNYGLSILATENNSLFASKVAAVNSLFISDTLFQSPKAYSVLSEHLQAWPLQKPIIIDSNVDFGNFATCLLLANIHQRRVHVSGVRSKEKLELISVSRSKGLEVTCDVEIFALFFSTEDYPASKVLPTKEDQDYIWNQLTVIDCFTIGSLPFELASELNISPLPPTLGLQETLPLLCKAVSDGRLRTEEIIERFSEAPARIFNVDLPKQTFVEIEVERKYNFTSKYWSPLEGKEVAGYINRVGIQDETFYQDGEFLSIAKHGIQHLRRTSVTKREDTKLAGNQSPSIQTAAAGPLPESMRQDLMQSSFGIESLRLAIDRRRALLELINNSIFYKRNVISVSNFSRNDLHILFHVATELKVLVEKEGVLDFLKGRVLVTMFFEPSTRTSASFNTAMQRLGGRVVPITGSTSSTTKGESLSDTIRTLACYGDALVLRHPSEDSAETAAKFSPVPVINGGNGSLEHPTQAFLDLYTIREELGTINGLTVTFVGDLKYGRTVHSLLKLLRLYEDLHVNLVSPEILRLPEHLRKEIQHTSLKLYESRELTENIVQSSDVLYCTRIQKERFTDISEYERVKDSFRIDNSVLRLAKQTMIVMHPLPRVREIAEEVDLDPRVAMFREMRFGLFVRMSLLAMVIGPTVKS